MVDRASVIVFVWRMLYGVGMALRGLAVPGVPPYIYDRETVIFTVCRSASLLGGVWWRVVGVVLFWMVELSLCNDFSS